MDSKNEIFFLELFLDMLLEDIGVKVNLILIKYFDYFILRKRFSKRIKKTC